MKALEHKVPPPVVAVTVGAIMWGLSLPGVAALPRSHAGTAVGIVIAALGVAAAVLGNIAFRRARTTVNPFEPETASSLVTSGIYRVTRNPMYVGMLLVLVGWAVFLANGLAVIAIALFPAYITRFQIKPEERALMALFGEQYASYSSHVRRWL
ncbi:MAG TPA: isoprenylcysteine carboxylmethyltransferase family protein [Ramlibacter sp.]|nr:isoprenylcysteine carboxylmethyltransferase family protein [Ramlibacter sp.]